MLQNLQMNLKKERQQPYKLCSSVVLIGFGQVMTIYSRLSSMLTPLNSTTAKTL